MNTKRLIRLAYENPSARSSLIPLIKRAMEFDTEEALDKYLKEHPGADAKKHSVKSPAEQGKALAQEAGLKGIGKKGLKLLSSAMSAAKNASATAAKSLKDFVAGGPEVRKKMLTDAGKEIGMAVAAYTANTVIGLEEATDESGKKVKKISVGSGAIGRAVKDEIHHVTDFASGMKALAKMKKPPKLKEGEEPTKEHKEYAEAKHKVAHSAWGVGILTAKMGFAVAAGVGAAATGGVGAALAAGGGSFGGALAKHIMVTALSRSPMMGNLFSTIGVGAHLAHFLHASQRPRRKYRYASDTPQLLTAKYKEAFSGDELPEGGDVLILMDMVSGFANQLNQGLDNDELTEALEGGGDDVPELKMSKEEMEKYLAAFQEDQKKPGMKSASKKKYAAELDVVF